MTSEKKKKIFKDFVVNYLKEKKIKLKALKLDTFR